MEIRHAALQEKAANIGQLKLTAIVCHYLLLGAA